MVARANKNHEQNVMQNQFDPLIPYSVHNYYTSSISIYRSFAHSLCICRVGSCAEHQERQAACVCISFDHEWKFVVFYLLARPKVKQDTLVVADGMKHVYHALCSGPHRTRQGRPRRYFRGRTAAQSSYPSFLFLYRLLNAATGWPSRGWYRDGRKSWRE
jgi:hypothetical protein